MRVIWMQPMLGIGTCICSWLELYQLHGIECIIHQPSFQSILDIIVRYTPISGWSLARELLIRWSSTWQGLAIHIVTYYIHYELSGYLRGADCIQESQATQTHTIIQVGPSYLSSPHQRSKKTATPIQIYTRPSPVSNHSRSYISR